ncbi:cellulose biosynthesis cyclic di-GMP-binding regulatory protein BcsB, partial [Okeania sp. SIO2G5]|uniref:cellulose biosynthesis cyclic di-GMP-binding regulatory protein BcsB n=1 Tax=Okeania sp. SIO2G5 TaxID=2607796 RepID=UPI0013C01828
PDLNQQLTGTPHASTAFNLKRDISLTLPDLELLKSGFPLAAPQDLSEMAVVLPDNPTQMDVEVLLALSKRLGLLANADSVKFDVYRASSLPNTVRRQAHLVGIGRRDRFPLPAAFSGENGNGFNLSKGFTRLWKGTQIQALPDNAGVIQSVVSNQSDDHIILALTAQTDDGMVEVRNTMNRDPLFNQLRGDTILVSRNEVEPSPYSASGYTITALQQFPQRRIQQAGSLSALSFFFQQYWFLIPTVLICLALLLYSISQIYLNRISEE